MALTHPHTRSEGRPPCYRLFLGNGGSGSSGGGGVCGMKSMELGYPVLWRFQGRQNSLADSFPGLVLQAVQVWL